jgi:hypothetical protein
VNENMRIIGLICIQYQLISTLASRLAPSAKAIGARTMLVNRVDTPNVVHLNGHFVAADGRVFIFIYL